MIYSMFWVQSFLCVLKSCAVLVSLCVVLSVELKAGKSIPNHKEGTIDMGQQDGDNELQLDRYPRRRVGGVWGTEDHMQVLPHASSSDSYLQSDVLSIESWKPNNHKWPQAT
jgi:hypothetical protein